MISDRSNNPRLLLAKLRKGDYTHAGDEEAIDLFLEQIDALIQKKHASNTSSSKEQQYKNKKALDIGCGLGGTANYIHDKTALAICGIDKDNSAIDHAKKHYSAITFFQCDVEHLNQLFKQNEFDIVYLFNVFYALPDQKNTLKTIYNLTKQNAILAIFDYTQSMPGNIELKDLANNPMNPIYLDDLKKWLTETGWKLIDIFDVTDKYEIWYSNLLEKLKSEKTELLSEFTDEAYDKVLSTFSYLLEKIKEKKLGGSYIYASRGEPNLR